MHLLCSSACVLDRSDFILVWFYMSYIVVWFRENKYLALEALIVLGQDPKM